MSMNASSSGSSDSDPSRPSSSPARSSMSPASIRNGEVSDASVRRYYYIYDSRQRRAIVMDRTTGDEFDWSCDDRAPLLDYVARRARERREHGVMGEKTAHETASETGEDLLRRFALWCARQAGADPDTQADSTTADMLPPPKPDAAPEEADDFDRQARELRAARRLYAAAQTLAGEEGPAPGPIREKTGDEAVIASAVGLSRMHPGAARLLAAQACTSEDPRQAALDAAHMGERFAEFAAHVAGNANPEAAARSMRRRQIDWLLDRLGEMA